MAAMLSLCSIGLLVSVRAPAVHADQAVIIVVEMASVDLLAPAQKCLVVLAMMSLL
jgi:hypothetical protein